MFRRQHLHSLEIKLLPLCYNVVIDPFLLVMKSSTTLGIKVHLLGGSQCVPILFMTYRSFSVILSSYTGNLSQVPVNLLRS